MKSFSKICRSKSTLNCIQQLMYKINTHDTWDIRDQVIILTEGHMHIIEWDNSLFVLFGLGSFTSNHVSSCTNEYAFPFYHHGMALRSFGLFQKIHEFGFLFSYQKIFQFFGPQGIYSISLDMRARGLDPCYGISKKLNYEQRDLPSTVFMRKVCD